LQEKTFYLPETESDRIQDYAYTHRAAYIIEAFAPRLTITNAACGHPPTAPPKRQSNNTSKTQTQNTKHLPNPPEASPTATQNPLGPLLKQPEPPLALALNVLPLHPFTTLLPSHLASATSSTSSITPSTTSVTVTTSSPSLFVFRA
jgi:hypothetical protein